MPRLAETLVRYHCRPARPLGVLGVALLPQLVLVPLALEAGWPCQLVGQSLVAQCHCAAERPQLVLLVQLLWPRALLQVVLPVLFKFPLGFLREVVEVEFLEVLAVGPLVPAAQFPSSLERLPLEDPFPYSVVLRLLGRLAPFR
ncbi:hypothetical protein B5M09_002088 [Aphanomyces astaci]|uniref:Uncharacterized protein n=1 Tax=Aphanomyces astaci TaxID=112090 RepID=A0A3R7Y8X8_APHAT|nr:hypothetical protein B5M09_002088 [Aphanomyces astaci]